MPDVWASVGELDAATQAPLAGVLETRGADGIAREWQRIGVAQTPHEQFRHEKPRQSDLLPHLTMPDRHDLRGCDVITRRLHGNLPAAAECGPRDFIALLQVPGVGARTVRALALVAEVLHGAPCRFSDPARFALAHGGKDRHPFPVPTRVYDHTIGVLKRAVRNARLGHEEQLQALRRLDAQARALERTATGPSVDALIAGEFEQSHACGGRSVFGWEPPSPSTHGGHRRVSVLGDI